MRQVLQVGHRSSDVAKGFFHLWHLVDRVVVSSLVELGQGVHLEGHLMPNFRQRLRDLTACGSKRHASQRHVVPLAALGQRLRIQGGLVLGYMESKF